MKTLPIAACLCLVACQPESKPAPKAPPSSQGEDASRAPLPEPSPPKVIADPSDASSYVGMSTEEASARADKAGIRWRIVEEDGKGRPVTKDHRPDRLNFAVAAGKIIRVTKG